eukprot:5220006-Ditylum_brightwellii.AAC.1
MLTHRANAVVVSKEMRKVSKKENEDGPTDAIFDKGEIKETTLNAEIEEQIQLPALPSANHFVVGDIATVHAAGVTVDDDNDPLPKIIPTAQTEDEEVKYDNWGYKGICYH